MTSPLTQRPQAGQSWSARQDGAGAPAHPGAERIASARRGTGRSAVRTGAFSLSFAALVLILASTLPATASSEDAGRCAALWFGVVDAGKVIPGYLSETENSEALARRFEKMAGAGGKAVIAQLRRDMQLLAEAYVIGDPESVMLFDRLAMECRKLE